MNSYSTLPLPRSMTYLYGMGLSRLCLGMTMLPSRRDPFSDKSLWVNRTHRQTVIRTSYPGQTSSRTRHGRHTQSDDPHFQNSAHFQPESRKKEPQPSGTTRCLTGYLLETLVFHNHLHTHGGRQLTASPVLTRCSTSRKRSSRLASPVLLPP